MYRGDFAELPGGISFADTDWDAPTETDPAVDRRLQQLLDLNGISDDVDEIVESEILLNYPEHFEDSE
jgi:hypothetical protein